MYLGASGYQNKRNGHTKDTHSWNDINIISFSSNVSIKNKATNATTSLPTTAEGTRFRLFPALNVAPAARPHAVIKPKISPKIFPNLQSRKIYKEHLKT